MITYDDLDDARDTVIRLARRSMPDARSVDTEGSAIRAGLVVVEVDVAGAMQFAQEITAGNLWRIAASRKQYQVDLFTAAIASGLCYGVQAERER